MSALPAHAARWLRGALPGPLPTERRATCDDCVMCDRPGAPPEPGLRYRPDVKCCTYLPELPNFLVGTILGDARPEARAGGESVRARIAARAGVLPTGLARTRLFDAIYDPSQTFGRAPGLLCPHYQREGGTCAIWRHRDAVCTTWFCRHERGVFGLQLWEAVRELLAAIEGALALHAAMEVGLGGAELHALSQWTTRRGPPSAEELGGEADGARLAAWGAWAGQEEAFYQRCAEIVAPLGWPDIERIGGVTVRAAARVATLRWEELHARATPATLALGHVEAVGREADGVHVVAHSPTDPVTVPRVVYDHLHVLPGPSASVSARFREASGWDLDAVTLRRLLDGGVLVAG